MTDTASFLRILYFQSKAEVFPLICHYTSFRVFNRQSAFLSTRFDDYELRLIIFLPEQIVTCFEERFIKQTSGNYFWIRVRVNESQQTCRFIREQ